MSEDNGKYKQSLENLKILAGINAGSDTAAKWIEKLRWLQSLIKQSKENVYDIAVSDQDIKILEKLLADQNNKLSRMNPAKYQIGARLGLRIDQDLAADTIERFSSGFLNIIKSHGLNKYGETTETGFEDIKNSDIENQKKGWWLRLNKAIIYAIANIINRDQDFGFLCTWILNHSNFIQIDTNSTEYDNKLVISNIRATWPSTAVDNVQLVPVPQGATYKYKLVINDDSSEIRDLSQVDFSDVDDFGWNNSDEIKNAYQLKPMDLAIFKSDFEKLLPADHVINNLPDPPKPKENFETKASLLIMNFFKFLAKEQVIDANIVKAKFNSPKQQQAIKDLVEKILANQITDDKNEETNKLTAIDRNVEYALRYLMSLSDDPTQFVTESSSLKENQDDDDDEYTPIQISAADRETAVEHLNIAKNMLLQVYAAIRMDRALSSKNEPNTSDENFLNQLYDVPALLAKRLNKTEKPRNTVRNYVPVRTQEQQIEDTAAQITPVINDFLETFNRLLKQVKRSRITGQHSHSETEISGTRAFLAILGASIIWGKYDTWGENKTLQNLFENFERIFENDAVKKIIQLQTLRAHEHDPTPITEQPLNEENIKSTDDYVKILTYLYWCFQVRKSVNNNVLPSRSLGYLVEIASLVFTNSEAYRVFIDAIDAIKEKFMNADQTPMAWPTGKNDGEINLFSKVLNAAKSDENFRLHIFNTLNNQNKEKLQQELYKIISRLIKVKPGILSNHQRVRGENKKVFNSLMHFTKIRGKKILTQQQAQDLEQQNQA